MFTDEAIPFVQIGNRRALTGMQLISHPELQDFVNRFPDSFEPAVNQDALLFIEPDDSLYDLWDEQIRVLDDLEGDTDLEDCDTEESDEDTTNTHTQAVCMVQNEDDEPDCPADRWDS